MKLSSLTIEQLKMLREEQQQKLLKLKNKEYCPACNMARELIELANEELAKRHEIH